MILLLVDVTSLADAITIVVRNRAQEEVLISPTWRVVAGVQNAGSGCWRPAVALYPGRSMCRDETVIRQYEHSVSVPVPVPSPDQALVLDL